MHLRTLIMYGLNDIVIIPKGFGGLTNLRILSGFPVHMDMDVWGLVQLGRDRASFPA